jgi:hypothetical protein
MLSRMVARGRFGGDAHHLVAAAGFSRLEWLLLYTPNAQGAHKSLAPALKALTELGLRDLAFAAGPLDENGLQELTRIVRLQPAPVVFVLNASDATKLRTRVGILPQATNRGQGDADAC